MYTLIHGERFLQKHVGVSFKCGVFLEDITELRLCDDFMDCLIVE